MRFLPRLLLLALVLGGIGCGGVKQLLPDPDAKTWVEVVPPPPAAVTPAKPLLNTPHLAPPVIVEPHYDGPSAADLAVRPAKHPDAYQQALRAAWKELKANHVPAQVLTIALNQAIAGGYVPVPDLSMPPDPGQLDLSTGGLGALLLAIVAAIVRRLGNPPSTSTTLKE